MAMIARTTLTIPLDGVALTGELALPKDASGVVLFAHGSGSGRFSRRNRFVAEALQQSGLGTLLVDLLTEEEEKIDRITRHYRFDMDLLATRLVALIDWLRAAKSTGQLSIGLFGASTGGGAALMAAAERPEDVAAVVSRGGRPDLAGNALDFVRTPTLLVVGGRDLQVAELNRCAYARLTCPKLLVIVPGATHLFEEPGTLERVAGLASEFFAHYLIGAPLNPEMTSTGLNFTSSLFSSPQP